MTHFEPGDVIRAGTEFSATVVETTETEIIVESRDGHTGSFQAGDLNETC